MNMPIMIVHMYNTKDYAGQYISLYMKDSKGLAYNIL
jgi:hypothetical protein